MTDTFKCPPDSLKHTVESGETFFSIAKKYKVSLDKLIEINPQIEDPSNIQVGQIICVPNPEFTCPKGTFSYTVKSGDTFFVIARRYHISLDTLIEINPQIEDPSHIKVGEVICIPKEMPKSCPPGTFSYTVKPGDTVFLLARRYQVSLDQLIEANPHLKDPSRLQVGDILCIPND